MCMMIYVWVCGMAWVNTCQYQTITLNIGLLFRFQHDHDHHYSSKATRVLTLSQTEIEKDEPESKLIRHAGWVPYPFVLYVCKSDDDLQHIIRYLQQLSQHIPDSFVVDISFRFL